MFALARRPSSRLLAAALLALTALIVGLAHRPFRLEPRGYGAEIAAYVLPDGTLPELCRWDDVGGHDPGDHGSGDRAAAVCDACVLTSAPGLGAVAAVSPLPPIERALERLAPRLREAAVAAEAPRPSSRGPPSIA